MKRLTACVVLGLGSVMLLGGLVGMVDAAREGNSGMSLVVRVLVLAVVGVGMLRATGKLREAPHGA